MYKLKHVLIGSLLYDLKRKKIIWLFWVWEIGIFEVIINLLYVLDIDKLYVMFMYLWVDINQVVN